MCTNAFLTVGSSTTLKGAKGLLLTLSSGITPAVLQLEHAMSGNQT